MGKKVIDCDFKSSSTIKSSMQSENVVENKIVSNTTFNTIDTTRSVVDSKFGNQIDVSTQVAALTNQLKDEIEADTDAKLINIERKIEHDTETRLNLFEQQMDVKIDSELNIFEINFTEQVDNKLDLFRIDVSNEIDTKFDIWDRTVGNKYVPQRLNAFGTMDISGDITPDKAYTYVDVKLPNNQYQSTRVDLADIVTTQVVTEDVNPDTTNLRTYDYIFTKLVREGD